MVVPHLGFLFRKKYLLCSLVTLDAWDLWATQYLKTKHTRENT